MTFDALTCGLPCVSATNVVGQEVQNQLKINAPPSKQILMVYFSQQTNTAAANDINHGHIQ